MEVADQEDTTAFEDEYPEGSIDEDVEWEWSAKHLLIGIALPALPWILMYLLGRWRYLQIRPWIADPLVYSLHSITFVTVVVYYIVVRRRLGLEKLFWFGSFRSVLKEIVISVLLMLALMLATWIIGYILMPALGIELEIPELWLRISYGSNSIRLLLVLIVGFTIAPVAEEIYYRGFVYRILKRRIGVAFALILQTVYFALVHGLDLPNTAIICFVGIVLAVVCEWRRNLLTPSLMHCTYNAIQLIPLIILITSNLYAPAADFSEAADSPKWLDLSTFEDVERQEDGEEQRLYAIYTWGSQGSRHWKREVKAFEAVSHWFPDERTVCARARFGIVHIYNDYLRDYRRAIVHGRRLLEEYPEQRELCADALTNMGAAYYMLKDFRGSRESYERVIVEYEEFEYALFEARGGIEWLDELEKVPLAERMHRRLRP